MNGARFTTAVCAVLSAVLAVGDADAEGDDKLARGLDVFTQMPLQAPSGGTLPVQIQAFGFPTVTKAVPLPLAKIEAAWDPRSLGPASVALGSVEVTADAGGRAHFDLPVPVGDEREMDLVLSVRAPGHERTRRFKVKRTSALDLALYVNDVRVVPDGEYDPRSSVPGKQHPLPMRALSR